MVEPATISKIPLGEGGIKGGLKNVDLFDNKEPNKL
jgi:hypothetical protein